MTGSEKYERRLQEATFLKYAQDVIQGRKSGRIYGTFSFKLGNETRSINLWLGNVGGYFYADRALDEGDLDNSIY